MSYILQTLDLNTFDILDNNIKKIYFSLINDLKKLYE
jgi:hypothetical protein